MCSRARHLTPSYSRGVQPLICRNCKSLWIKVSNKCNCKCGKRNNFFEENISGFFSTQWTSMVTKLLKSKSMQFQRIWGIGSFLAKQLVIF